jgi:hypothetical protein
MIHGRDDQVLPFAHGVALSEEIKEAKLLPLEVLGMTYLAGFGMLFSRSFGTYSGVYANQIGGV